MRTNPNIITSGNQMAPPQLPDVNAMMQTRTAGMENIYAIEQQRAEQQRAAQKEQEAAAAEAMLPSVLAAYSDASDIGLDRATSLMPSEVRDTFAPFITQLKTIPDMATRKAILEAELAKDEAGRAVLDRILTPYQEGTLGIQRGQLELSKAELEQRRAEASAAGPKVSFRETDAEGNVRMYDAAGKEIGMLPKAGKPAAAAGGNVAKANTPETKFKVDETLSEMLASYNRLKEYDAIVSTEDSAVGNVIARTGAALGTTVGRAVGTKSQTERDYIQNLRTDLIRDIKLATGMSAQELNSNFELQNALDALGDPYGQSFETAIRTIAKISRKYGLGNVGADVKTDVESPDAPAPSGIRDGATATNPQTGERIIYRNGQWQPL